MITDGVTITEKLPSGKILKYKSYKCLCSMEIFTIDNIKCDTIYFGEGWDEAPSFDSPYCCGNYVWHPYTYENAIMDEEFKSYNISKDDFEFIVDILTSELSFGCCGWCE